MKFKLILTILFFAFLKQGSSQYVEISHLHDFVDLGYPTGLLINSSGNLVQVRNEWGVAVFTIYDTTNYQILAQSNPSNQLFGSVRNNFSTVRTHQDSGYLVVGTIPLENNTYSTPIVYWYNENAEIINSFEGPHTIPPEQGERPYFSDIFTRSDGHIIALYQASKSTSNDTGMVSVLYEFDNLLNLIGLDTLSTNSVIQLSYSSTTEEITVFGTNYFNNPWRWNSFVQTIDAFSLISLNQTIWPKKEYIYGVVLELNHAFILARQITYSPYSSSMRVYKYNFANQIIEDSIIFTHDSIVYESYSLKVTDSNLFMVLSETDIRKSNIDRLDNHFLVLDYDLTITVDSVINDISERFVSSQYFDGTELFLNYGKTTNPTFTYVFLKISLSGVTSVNSIQKRKASWLAYPNPTNSGVYIKVPVGYRSENLTYYVHTISGVLIRGGHFNSNIDMNSLPKGLYILSVLNSNQVLYTTKISKL